MKDFQDVQDLMDQYVECMKNMDAESKMAMRRTAEQAMRQLTHIRLDLLTESQRAEKERAQEIVAQFLAKIERDGKPLH
jgi:hypothetical protein